MSNLQNRAIDGVEETMRRERDTEKRVTSRWFTLEKANT